MKGTLPGVHHLLISTFIFLGPLGNLLTPAFFPSAFRMFYFLLICFPLFFHTLRIKELRYLLFFLPLIFYIFISAYITQSQEAKEEVLPLFRSFLFACEFLFMFGMVITCNHQDIAKQCHRLIRLYLYAFFLSLIVGYILYIGFYTQIIALASLERFCVQTQFAYGLLRFSPGSYPNEYGVVASFVLSISTLFIAEKQTPTFPKQLRKIKWMVYLFYFPTWIALILSTTRAAYLTFFLSFLYLLFTSSHARRTFFFPLLSLLSILGISMWKFPFLFQTLLAPIQTASLTTGSVGTRIQQWLLGMGVFDHSVLFGTGFASLTNTHNTYLQMLYELGIVGLFFLIIPFMIYGTEKRLQICAFFSKRSTHVDDLFSNRVITIGLIHVFFFALTNHNLHHHLTWFIFFLFNLKVFYGKKKEAECSPLLPTPSLINPDLANLDLGD